MLVVFPLGLWVTAVGFDIAAMITGNPTFRVVAFYNIGVGILGALAAAVPGLMDYFTLSGRAARIATFHMLLNVSALTLFSVSWLLRTRWAAGIAGTDSWVAEVLAMAGLAVLAPAGWLGGELVFGAAEDTTKRESAGRRAA